MKNKMIKKTGLCMVNNCPKDAVWFNVSKSRKTICAKYCEKHYRIWAIPQKVGRKEGWEK